MLQLNCQGRGSHVVLISAFLDHLETSEEQRKLTPPRTHLARIFDAMDSELQISEELESHLIDLYFMWEQPWCQVVDESLFRESRATNGRYFSPLLLNCILAIGSRHSDRPEIRSNPDNPQTAGRVFLDKAEVLLYYDLKWPSITTIQSLSILGTIYVVLHTSFLTHS